MGQAKKRQFFSRLISRFLSRDEAASFGAKAPLLGFGRAAEHHSGTLDA
jgi:hypothetical protein